jgi:hypothetical protein
MVGAGEVHRLKGERLLLEFVSLAKGDAELDVPKGHGILT